MVIFNDCERILLTNLLNKKIEEEKRNGGSTALISALMNTIDKIEQHSIEKI